MALIDDIKVNLRIKSVAYDTDIEDLIESCKIDLKIAGVVKIVEDEALTKQAIKLYCKGYFGFDENSEKFQAAYLALKQSMSLCGDYNTVSEVV